ncbi:DUF5691 domain-containing protein, partial [Acrocarpospora catenulata]|uniref:DUF5691 domain-containing protein n=1 Tax=Acrocarpospora catenulata TaxID=2836182 RepID=UPI001BDAA787
EETRPAAPRRAGDRLARMLGGEHPRLVEEWLEIAAERGVRVPAPLIPPLLDLGARDRSIRARLAVLTGARGRWLAGLNPAWAYLLGESSGAGDALDHGIWEFGAGGDRRAFLARLRAADPGQARELLAVGWASESGDDRAAFLAAFADGLSMADEPFLESALDDRRREARQTAADLLTRLPDSRLGRRMAERAARALVRVGDTLTARPPQACDSAMERDGLRARPPAGGGERGWWLQQVISHTPLAFWPGHLGGTVAEITRLDLGDWAREVRMGWTRAAILQRDPEWARALLDIEPLTDLLAVLPPDEQSQRAAQLVYTGKVDGQLIMMLGGVPRPWGEPLARAVLTRITELAAKQPWNAGELANLAAVRIDPGWYDQVARFAEHGEMEDLAAILRFRSDMIKEFS